MVKSRLGISQDYLLIFSDSQVMVVGKAQLENLSKTVQRGSWSISSELGADSF